MKTWIITGASSGFGKELALYLAQQDNINLVATARKIQTLDYLKDYDHGQIERLTLDVTKETDINSVITQTTKRFQAIDVLVNNAGIGYFGSFEETDIPAARKLFEVNYWGLINMTRAVLPTMRQQHDGIIINMASVGGLAGFPIYSFYNSSKFAVEGISEALAGEVAPFGIKLMMVEPSGFKTKWGAQAQVASQTIDDYQKLHQNIAARKQMAHDQTEAGNPKEAAKLIFETVNKESNDLPFHLLLGKLAVKTAVTKYTRDLETFKSEAKLAESADYSTK